MKNYHALVRHLKKIYPQINLSVRRTAISKKTDGYCQLNNGVFNIRINKDLEESVAIETLVHEVAHALSWKKDTDIHGKNWGHTYSKVYRDFLNWLEEQNNEG